MASDEEELPVKDIATPLDTDVLCGRGGAALRHPGNQTYRSLVQLNKGLYISCLKMEKLKISKSIVAAIREQKGRFLEKDNNGTWYDIGDKKATEKTSQALREGQPKLKEKFEELSGNPAAMLESQLTDSAPRHSFNSSYVASDSSPRQSFNNSYAASDSTPRQSFNSQYVASDSSPRQSFNSQYVALDPSPTSHSFNDYTHPTNLATSAAFIATDKYNAALSQQQYAPKHVPSNTVNTPEMPPPAQIHDMMSQRLSLLDIQEVSVPHLRPSIIQRGSIIARELGVDSSGRSFMSDFSDYGMRDSSTGLSSDVQKVAEEGDLSQQTFHALLDVENRRSLFAKMKFNRRGAMNTSDRMMNSSEKSSGDGMPEIHMLESNMSLYSTVSSFGDPGIESRSITSGLSRIPDTSDNISMFSDLSKNIGNVSTRSICMSELSNMDDIDLADLPDKPANDTSPPNVASCYMEYGQNEL